VRSLRVVLCVMLAATMVAAVPQRPVDAAPSESPARKIARLRAEAASVQRAIDRMNNQIERLVEDYNANTEALARTVAAERQTVRRLRAAERRLDAAQLVLDRRVRAIYVYGPATGLGQLLGATDVHDALTRARYQESVVVADEDAIRRVEDARSLLRSIAGDLARQRRAQERLRERLGRQRAAISNRLDAQRHYLARVNRAVRRAVEQERRRQEQLRRQALARRLAAARAAARARARARHWSPRLRPGPGGTRAARRAVAYAMAQLGKPYAWGAVGPNSFDCSGLTMTAYARAGISLPRVSRSQWYAGPHLDLVDLAPGDLLFFADNLSNPSSIHHVGMYVGRGLMVEAPFSGASVRLSSIGRGDYIGAVRPTG
jgi:cell wall-associated NlpC family hydrolase